MKTLGIIGGMSPESTVSYYTEINHLVNQTLGANYSAPILMFSVQFEEIVRYQKSGEWDKAGEILANGATRLVEMGADAIVLATNTMHKVAPQIIDAINVPFLHILDATANAIKTQGLSKVALLGTRFTMQDPFYRNGLAERGITALVPDDKQQAEIHRIIFDELCVGHFNPTSKQIYLDIIATLVQQGAEGVILGCTEIGLLIKQTDSIVPFFDTAQLHSQMAATFILNNN